MAEPVSRDPVPAEPVRRPGPQAIRAGTVKHLRAADRAGEAARTSGVPADPIGAISEPMLPELPPPPPAPSARGPRTRAPRTPASGAPSSTQGTSPHSASNFAPQSRPPKAHTPAQEMLEELRTRLDELRERVEKQTVITGMTLRRELSEDAEYIKIRARHYHERRPLQALYMVAVGTFALGLFLGLWRR